MTLGPRIANLDAIIAAAMTGARSVIAGGAMGSKLPLRSTIEVDDEHGNRALELPFREAVLIDG